MPSLLSQGLLILNQAATRILKWLERPPDAVHHCCHQFANHALLSQRNVDRRATSLLSLNRHRIRPGQKQLLACRRNGEIVATVDL